MKTSSISPDELRTKTNNLLNESAPLETSDAIESRVNELKSIIEKWKELMNSNLVDDQEASDQILFLQENLSDIEKLKETKS